MSDRRDNEDCCRSRVDELIDAFTWSDGCNSCLLAIIVPIVFVVLVYGLWILFTTPAPEPLTWDPSYLQGVPGLSGDTPTPLPSGSWLPF
jgi:hypothetical protein